MGIKKLSWSGALAVFVFVAPAFADTISGSGGAGFQSWAATNLNENGSPYWDNTSMDGPQRNVGFFLLNSPTAPLSGAPGALPYWGNSFSNNTDTGGSADLNFFFQKTAPTSTVALKLEVAGRSDINEFGWYDATQTNTMPTLHPLILGLDAPPTTNNFSPTAQYGLYLKTGASEVYFTQSSLNSGGDTAHQHFAVFRDTTVAGAPASESYWIGVEDLATSEFGGNEGNVGDYQDLLIRLSVLTLPSVPEPSTAMLVLGGSALVFGFKRRRSKRTSRRGF